MSKPITKEFENVQMHIMGKVRTIPRVKLTKYPNGHIGISVDEYNRIMWELHMEWKRKWKERWKIKDNEET